MIQLEAPGPTFLTSQKQWVRILQVFSCLLALANSFPCLDCLHCPSGNFGYGRDPTCLVALLGLQRDEILVFNALSNDAFNQNVLVNYDLVSDNDRNALLSRFSPVTASRGCPAEANKQS